MRSVYGTFDNKNGGAYAGRPDLKSGSNSLQRHDRMEVSCVKTVNTFWATSPRRDGISCIYKIQKFNIFTDRNLTN